jgi:hypothetical protein
VVAEDDVAVLLEECKPGSTLVEHPQNYLQKVLTSKQAQEAPSWSIAALTRALKMRSWNKTKHS